jgi:hypothetical protein
MRVWSPSCGPFRCLSHPSSIVEVVGKCGKASWNLAGKGDCKEERCSAVRCSATSTLGCQKAGIRKYIAKTDDAVG